MKKALVERDRDVRPDRYVDVDYQQLVADPIGTVRNIYGAYGYPFTPEFETAMRLWLQKNRQHRHGRHQYTAEDFGLNRDQIHKAFADYRKRFNV